MKLKYYMVGGCVRDQLMEKNPHDYDFVVVGATEDYMKEKYGDSVGEGFPVYFGLVPGYEHLGKVEIAMARTEVKIGEGHKGFTFKFSPDVTLEQDLQRRDFTINAIAQDLDTKEIIDYYGGKEDIKNKIIRHVNSDGFIEDPLRVMRMARFSAQLGFEIAQETLELSKDINIGSLTIERVWGEIYKALESESPEKFFRALLLSGHLFHFFPELVKLVDMEQAYHDEDAFDHTMMVLQEAIRRNLSIEARFALLLHDLGKGETPEDILPHHYDHNKRSFDISKEVCLRWKVPCSYEKLATWFAKEHMRLHMIEEMGLGTLTSFAEAIVKNHYDVEMIIQMSECDSQERYTVDWARLKEAINVIKTTSADDIVEKGFEGKKVGELLHQKRVEELRKRIFELKI